MKHDGLWDLERAPDGRLVWTSPWGRRHYSEPAEWTRPAAPASDAPDDDPVPWD